MIKSFNCPISPFTYSTIQPINYFPIRLIQWRKRFVLSLYELGLKRETIYAIYQFIEWLMELPDALEEKLYQEIREEEDEEMSLLTIAEKRKAWKKGFNK